MHSLHLFTLITLLFSLSLSQTPAFYVDETSNSSNPDGSKSNPFPSLEEAAHGISSGTFDIVLLGESVTIFEEIVFPKESICTIRPETVPESGHYPLRIVAGASMEFWLTNVTFQDIEFVEFTPEREYDSFIIVGSGLLFLNRVLLSDIQGYRLFSSIYVYSPTPSFSDVSPDEVTGAVLLLLDCQFRNLRNVQIETDRAQSLIQNTRFDNIEMNDAAFFELNSFDDSKLNVRILNTSLTNSRFGQAEGIGQGGFFSLKGTGTHVSFEEFFAKNVSIKNQAIFIEITELELDNEQENPTTVNFWSFIFEDVVEIEDPPRIYEHDNITEEFGLIFNLSGLIELSVRNLTARNVKLENRSLLTYFQYVNIYDPYESSPSQVSLQDIKIENSSNTNFLISFPDRGQVENVELVNVESQRFSVFFFQNSKTVSVKDIHGRNISGSVISLDQVLNQNLQNLTFSNVSMSQENSLIFLTRYFDTTHLEAIANVDQSTIITDLFIDGSEYNVAEDQEEQESQAYLMTVQAEFGTVLIRDSIWKNINTRDLFVSNQEALQMENFTVNGAPAQATGAE